MHDFSSDKIGLFIDNYKKVEELNDKVMEENDKLTENMKKS